MSTITAVDEVAATASGEQTPELIRAERDAVRLLRERAAERDKAEVELTRRRTSRDETADKDYRERREALDARRLAKDELTATTDHRRRAEIAEALATGQAAAKAEFSKVSRKLAGDFDHAREDAKKAHDDAKWEAGTVFDAAERGNKDRDAEYKHRLKEAVGALDDQRDRTEFVVGRSKKLGVAEVAPLPSMQVFKTDEPIGLLVDRIAKVEPGLQLLEGLAIPKAMAGRGGDVGLFILLFAALIYPLGSSLGWDVGAGVAAGVALAGAVGLRIWLFGVARMQVNRGYLPIAQQHADAAAIAEQAAAWVAERYKSRRDELVTRRDEDLRKARKAHDRAITAAEDARDDRLQKANARLAQLTGEAKSTYQRDGRLAAADRDQKLAEARAEHEGDLVKLESAYQQLKAEIRSRHESAWGAMADRWRSGVAEVSSTLARVNAEVDAIGPRWGDPAWASRPLAAALPPVLRLGQHTLELAQVPGGVPRAPALREDIPTSFSFPSLYAFPDRANLLIEASGPAGREAANALLQAAMMRLLTSLPPGKVRFTILDPVGLGRNFSAFMHLADHDEALVGTRIWTEGAQIEERLAETSAHMEKVIQRYLRNEYASIEEYNANAGEVAEPFRVLVVADFPVGFDEQAGRRLQRIVAGGVRCGVLTMIAVDKDRELPANLGIEELREHSTCVAWRENALVPRDDEFRDVPLALDPPAPAAFATPLLHKIGAAAKLANRVEVPFEFIAPPEDQLWTKDSRAGIEIALGKAGAKKTQPLSLGKGTSQHVLIAGRTGSGKSTLLHALITNLALNYSPDEVELYLVDFKKGVEFKTYATHGLPHARVIAVESDREFGVSVLQRLDEELKRRADLYRDAGVQDVKGYRDVPGAPPLPRVLLIVDEFQEFFTEDDRIAQEASLLLDRLVRQGRAFGVHIHLGSQTLSGAASLARSTMGQMGIRIALQCSEADSHAILSEDNPAARLLSRPGEAVYNDANGMPEGNHYFQVVWLTDQRRERYLHQLRDLAAARPPKLKHSTIVFEGNVPAVLPDNPLLKPLIDAPTWPPTPRGAKAWLGDAVAIKDPTAVTFRRQGGSNVLILGQDEVMAQGVTTAMMLSLAAQYAPTPGEDGRGGAKFYVVDGTPEDSPMAGKLAALAEVIPHPLRSGGWRDTGPILAEVAAELARRQEPGASDGPEIFVFLHDLPRLRDLRKKEDDYSYGSKDEPASPADSFAALLKEGSGFGIHVVVWCDNLNNMNRAIDRSGLREFEWRVLFQMSPTDSSHLIDAPTASRLGENRALLASEEQGKQEKFRPYGLPSAEWLKGVKERLGRKA